MHSAEHSEKPSFQRYGHGAYVEHFNHFLTYFCAKSTLVFLVNLFVLSTSYTNIPANKEGSSYTSGHAGWIPARDRWSTGKTHNV
jgi:hypothetical protein